MSLRADSKILVVLLGSLGDIARALAIVSPIKKSLPNSSIDWVVDKSWAELVKLHPGIRRTIIFDRDSWLTSLSKFIGELRSESYDVVIDLQRILKSGLISQVSRSSRKIGFNRADSKEGNWLFMSETIGARSQDYPKIEHYLDFVKFLGIPVAQPYDFGVVAPSVSNRLRSELEGQKAPIGVVIGTSWESKRWPIEHYSSLVSNLLEKFKDSKVVLIGGQEDRPSGEKIVATSSLQDKKNARIVDLTGRTSIPELLGIMSSFGCLVGPDSGPMHLASICRVPYVSLFGPTSAARVAPYGNEMLVLSAGVSCSPCYKRICPGMGGICMKNISPGMVSDMVERSIVKSSI